MTVYEMYQRNLDTLRSERKAATATMKALEPARFDLLCEEAEKATFAVRQYGQGQFYCWIHHPAIKDALDPWPGSRFPKAVVCIEIARALNV
jgi:hypothetical protein